MLFSFALSAGKTPPPWGHLFAVGGDLLGLGTDLEAE